MHGAQLNEFITGTTLEGMPFNNLYHTKDFLYDIRKQEMLLEV